LPFFYSWERPRSLANLEPGTPGFRKQLERFDRNPPFRGIRCGNLWGRNLADQISSPWQPRAQFPAGKFVAPHDACFDHEGNIFVVERVEIGRVTTLRRLG
jgi:hypothetical protein